MGERVVLETTCEHGQYGKHSYTYNLLICNGGNRRVLVDAEPDRAQAKGKLVQAYKDGRIRPQGEAYWHEVTDEILDAALEGLRVVKETD